MKNNVIATLPCYTTLGAFFTANDAIAFIPSAIGAQGNFCKLETAEKWSRLMLLSPGIGKVMIIRSEYG